MGLLLLCHEGGCSVSISCLGRMGSEDGSGGLKDGCLLGVQSQRLLERLSLDGNGLTLGIRHVSVRLVSVRLASVRLVSVRKNAVPYREPTSRTAKTTSLFGSRGPLFGRTLLPCAH